jgi:hypothetical protein
MRLDLSLKPRWDATLAPLTFSIDFDSGALEGRDAARVRQMIELAIAAGYVTTHPWPTAFPLGDPYRDITALALVLGVEWVLTEELSRAHPVAIEDDGEDDYPGLVH